RRHKLEIDLAIDARISSAIHHAHATLTNAGEDFIRSESRARSQRHAARLILAASPPALRVVDRLLHALLGARAGRRGHGRLGHLFDDHPGDLTSGHASLALADVAQLHRRQVHHGVSVGEPYLAVADLQRFDDEALGGGIPFVRLIFFLAFQVGLAVLVDFALDGLDVAAIRALVVDDVRRVDRQLLDHDDVRRVRGLVQREYNRTELEGVRPLVPPRVSDDETADLAASIGERNPDLVHVHGDAGHLRSNSGDGLLHNRLKIRAQEPDRDDEDHDKDATRDQQLPGHGPVLPRRANAARLLARFYSCRAGARS